MARVCGACHHAIIATTTANYYQVSAAIQQLVHGAQAYHATFPNLLRNVSGLRSLQ